MDLAINLGFTFPHQKLLVLLSVLFLILSVQNKGFVYCARSASSASSAGSSESTGATGASSSLASSNRERELISAQFRAAVQDGRDLDTGETPASIDSLQAAAAAAQLAAAGLTEEEAQLMPKYIAASGSAYAPSKLRLNRYSQTGFYDPYPSYMAAFSNNVPSSYYPYNTYTGYRDNPMLDTYPYYEKDRLREIQMRAMQSHSPAASSYIPASSTSSSSNRDGFGGNNFYNGPGGGGFREGFRSNDNDPAAAGHGGGGHDEGGGHGWGHVNHYTSKVNTNAIGLLGLLGLLSLLSNVLLQFTTTTTTTTTAAGRRRKKRSVLPEEVEEDHERRRERIFMEILPHLTPVAHARDGTLPLDCTFHGICMANKVLVNELGAHGRPAGARISSAIVKLLDKVTPGSSSSKGKTGKSELKKKLESAGLHGRDKKDCEKSYPICTALRQQESPNLPFVIRMQDLPQLISKVSKLSQGTWGGRGVPMNL